MNLQGSVCLCMCFPCVYINLEEQHLAKSGRNATEPRSSLPLSDAKPNLSASPHRLHSPSSLEPLSINTDSTPGHGVEQAPFNKYHSPPPGTRITISPDPRGFNEATCGKPEAHSLAPRRCPVVTVSLPSGLLDPEEPSGAPTPVIFNQEGITLAPGEPTESEWTPGMCTVTKLS